jgi:myo-inositol-1(or 4)-monophosphatase
VLSKDFGKKGLADIVGIGYSGDDTIRADRLAEEAALKKLHEIGNVEVMSEEAGLITYGKPQYRVILDPLDGSSNYARGIPLFSVSVEVRKLPDDEPIMGVIYDPIHQMEFSAQLGGGAYLNGSKIHTNHERRFEECLFDLDLHTAADNTRFSRFVDAFRKFGVPLKSFRSVGSCAISLAYTACGTLDGFLDFSRNSRMVDIAAGLLILREAGGTVTDIEGRSIKEGYDSLIACSTEIVNRRVRELIS